MRWCCALLGAVFVISVPETAPAQWRPGGVPLVADSQAQEVPMVASDGAGGAIVVWRDRRSGSSWDVYAQRVDASGLVRWGADGTAVSAVVGDQNTPVVVDDQAGGAIVAWIDRRTGVHDIYAQRLDAAGVSQWTGDGIAVTIAAGDQRFPSIVGDGSHGAIVGWSDERGGSISVSDIYAQRLDGTGSPQWAADGLAVSTAAGRQHAPVASSDGAGGAIFHWTDLRNGGTWDLYSQRVTATGGTPWTPDGVPVSTASLNQHSPAGIPDGFGGMITVWVDGRNGQDDVYIQRIDGSGGALWTADGVPLAVAVNNKFHPRIIPDGSGGAIVVWHDFRNGSTNADIYAQRVDASGVSQWAPNGIALSAAPGHQVNPATVPDGMGGAFVVWADLRTGTNWDLYAQHVDVSGTARWGTGDDDRNGIPVSTASNGIQSRPQMVADGSGGAIVVWHDYRNGNADVFAQYLDTSASQILAAPDPDPAPSLIVHGFSPNPFSGRTSVDLELASPTTVRLEVFDLAGRRVHYEEHPAGAGIRRLALEGRDRRDRPLLSGVYFCRVSAAGQSVTWKLVIR